MAQNKYMQFQLIAPPASRFFQLADGNFSLYFEKARVAAMVEWAENQLAMIQRLATMIAGEEVQAKQEEVSAQQASQPPKPVTAPNIKTVAAPAKPAAPMTVPEAKTQQGQDALRKMGLSFSPEHMKGGASVGGVPLTTQEEIIEKVPEAPPPKPPIDYSNDPGIAIALQQQRMLDAQKGIDREAKNKAPEEASATPEPEPEPEPEEPPTTETIQ